MADTAQERLADCGGEQLIGPHGVLTQTWGQGFVVGALVILFCLTISNMRRKALLHILILTELILASLHGIWVFIEGPASGWYLSATATTLYISYNLHSIINWMKVKPFLSRWGSRFYIGTVILAMPYWIASMYLNFAYFNNLGTDVFRRTRPWETLFREPWWVFTALYLVYVIKRCYGFGVWELVRSNARFFVLLASMVISIALMIVDVVDISFSPYWGGVNLYWQVSMIFKCMADAVFLDDFKHVLDRLTARTTGNFLGLPPDRPNPPGQFITGNDILLGGLSSNYTQRGEGDEEMIAHIEDQQYRPVVRPRNAHLSLHQGPPTFVVKA